MAVMLIIVMVVLSALMLQLRDGNPVAKNLEKLLPLYKVENGCILSKQGDTTVVFSLCLPEIFTLSADEYEAMHHAWVRAIKVLPAGTILHKQDWFTRNTYKADLETQHSFLGRASEAYFHGRPFLGHSCYLMVTRKATGRKPGSSVFSNLLRPSIVAPQPMNSTAHSDFMDKVSQFEKLLGEGGFIKPARLDEDALCGSHGKPGLIEQYCFLAPEGEQPLMRDILFKPDFRIGEKHCQLYAMSDVEDLPSLCGSRITYDKYSTDKTKFSVGFAAPAGPLLDCNHIYNQYIFIEDTQKVLKKLETKRRRLQSLSAYSRENAISRDSVNAFLNEAISQQRLPVRAHFNLLVWSDDAGELKDLRNKASSALAQMDAAPRQEVKGAAQIFWAGLPGNAADFPLNDSFETFAEQASCFLNVDSNYRSDPPAEGIRFCDRMTGKPVYIDLFDAPRKAGITSNMGMLVCGTSGGGKSMTVNHILRTLYDQGAHCVVIDIGGSYKGLCELVGGYYFTYTEENPIRFNPFVVGPEGLDTEKKESLKSLLVALWKQENESFIRSEYVALSNALTGYYSYLKDHREIFPCFNSFYEYLESQYVDVLKGHKVKDRDFDIDNFLYVLRPYYAGGEFDYLLNATENLDLLNQQFVVIELDNIKDHPILFGVTTLICMEMFISKMRKLPGKRKVLMIDEAWKAIANSGMADFLRYAFKTIRKFNGIPGVITQELDDLVSSQIIKDAIINNADIKILMDMRKFMNKFDKLQDVLGMSEKAKTILLSVNKDNREIFVDLGGQVMKVFKNELCPHEYYAYTTEGKERVRVMEYAKTHGSMEKGINALVNDLDLSKRS